MNEHEFERAFQAWSQSEASEPASPGLRARALAVPRSTPERRRLQPPYIGRFQTMFDATKLVLAGAIVALFGGVLLTGVVTDPSGERSFVGVSPSAAVQPSATGDVSDTSAPEVETAVEPTDPRLAGDGPWLRLERDTADGDTIFEAARGEPRGSTGLPEPWPDQWQAEGFGFLAAMDNTDDDGDDRLYVAVSRPDGGIVQQRLGQRQSPIGKLFLGDPPFVIAGTGILMQAERDDALRTWYSPDGEDWLERPGSWRRGDDLVGTATGFIRIRGDRLDRSLDGTDWARVPGTYPLAHHLGEWAGDQIFAHVTEEGPRIGRLSEAGIEALPYFAEAFGEQRPERGTRGDAVVGWSTWPAWDAPSEDGEAFSLVDLVMEPRFTIVGGLGIVHLDRSSRTIVFTPDGTRWSAIAMPEDWLPLKPTPPSPFGSGAGNTVTLVTDDSVIISASVATPGVGEEGRSKRTYIGTVVEEVSTPDSETR